MLYLLMSAALGAGHADLQTVLNTHVSKARVDYAAVKETKALDGYLLWLASAPEPADREAKMAFWINAYNALTIDMMADEWPVSSIRDLDGGKVWDTRKFTVAGKQVSLNDIEHKILRPLGDARIHAAVNCASKGCPPLPAKVFEGPTLATQLDAASAQWMRANGINIDKGNKIVRFNKIFDWYGEDFVAGAGADIPGVEAPFEGAAHFAAAHMSDADRGFLLAGGYETGWFGYSWEPNSR